MRPIDTAPRDGTEILVSVKCSDAEIRKFVAHWYPGSLKHRRLSTYFEVDPGWYIWERHQFKRVEPIDWLPIESWDSKIRLVKTELEDRSRKYLDEYMSGCQDPWGACESLWCDLLSFQSVEEQ